MELLTAPQWAFWLSWPTITLAWTIRLAPAVERCAQRRWEGRLAAVMSGTLFGFAAAAIIGLGVVWLTGT